MLKLIVAAHTSEGAKATYAALAAVAWVFKKVRRVKVMKIST